MCPNAPLTQDLRYDDVTGGGFVVVSTVPLSLGQRDLLAARGTEVLEVEPGSPLCTWLADGKAAVALVRPDFTVLRVGRDVATLCEGAPTFLQRQDPLAHAVPRPPAFPG
jgi:3-(3-hydroxy-phenyl)propionate hydroxylase